MSKVWEPQHIDVYRDWVKAILEEASNELTDWENSFIASIEERLNKYNRNLSQAQAEALERIYTNKTS